jgi:hypothetical protein
VTPVNVGKAGSVQDIEGPLNISDLSGNAAITVDGSADAGPATVTLDTFIPPGDPEGWGSITGLSGEQINYQYSSTVSLTLKTGATDTVNVLATGPDTTTTLTGGKNTALNVGKAGSLDGLNGDVDIDGSANDTVITVDDSADAGAHTMTLDTFTPSGGTPWGSIAGLACTINYEYAATSSLTIKTGSNNNDVVNVLATGPTTDLVESGNPIVTVGKAGSVQKIHGDLNIDNPKGHDTITVDDSADFAGLTVALDTFTPPGGTPWGSITGLAPAAINFKYAGTHSLTLKTGAADTVNVLATGVTTNLIGNWINTVNVGNAGSVQAILGTLNIDNPKLYDFLNVDDSADFTGLTVTLGTFTPLNDSSWGSLAGLAPAAINFKYAAMSSVSIETGAADTVNVLATGVTTNLTGNWINTVNVGNAGSVQGILGTINIDNPKIGDNLSINDSGDTATHTATLGTFTPPGDTPWGSLTGLAPAAINYEYADMSSVAILTGPATTLNVQDTGGTPTTVNGKVAGGAAQAINFLPPSITPTPPQDITALVKVQLGRPQRGISSRQVLQTVTVRNVTSTTINGPITLVFQHLGLHTPILSANGVTRRQAPLKSPFIELALDGGHPFAPGDTLTVHLRFAVPAGQKPKYKLNVVAGVDNR